MENTSSKYPVFQDFKNPNIFMWLLLYIFITATLAVAIGNMWAAICFWLAAYAVIGNDAVQTLMTFIHSNRDVPTKILYLWVAAVLMWVLWYGFLTSGWDISYGRLDAEWYANVSIKWYFAIFPLILVFLTRFRGIPVSTSLLMLSIFSGTLLFEKIVIKSASGYIVAFLASFVLWIIAEWILKYYNLRWDDIKTRKSVFWRIAQAITTALLFGTWLMHDMVNIAVFLPSSFDINVMLLISGIFLLWLAYTFYISGGPVGNIVTRKTNTNEIIAATMIDLVYFMTLLVFKEWSNIPMSTTWVFVGLLAGRQFAIRAVNRLDRIEWPGRMNLAFKESWKDFSKIMVWLWISLLALVIVRYLTGT